MDPITWIAAATAALKLVDNAITALEERRANGGKEWTKEEEEAYDALIAERMKAAHWKPSGRTS